MAERARAVHNMPSPPQDSSYNFKMSTPSSPEYQESSVRSQSSPIHHQYPQKPVNPPPGTYVIQIPKDQVYRVPPPENATRYAQLSRRKPHGNDACRRCICWSLAILICLLLLLGIVAAILYLVYRPESPKYSVQSISIKNLNWSVSTPISPEINVSVRADNPNDHIQIYYLSGSSVNVYYNDVSLCNGVIPVFKQGTNNVTDIVLVLNGSGIELNSAQRNTLRDEQGKGTVPLRLDLNAPVKMKIGSIKTWKITVKVTCDMVIDKLTSDAKIVSNNCDYGVDIW